MDLTVKQLQQVDVLWLDQSSSERFLEKMKSLKGSEGIFTGSFLK